jgi:hypothetical protein
MSIAGYFCKRGSELRMPKTEDSLGIRYEGAVLTGEKSVEQRQRDDAIRAISHSGESSKTVEDYLAALRAQGRL